jgi:hypothetical protein
MRQQAGTAESVANAVDMAVRGDAASEPERAQQRRDAVDRSQLARERIDYARPHVLDETRRQRAPEFAFDRGTQGHRVFADAERYRLVHAQPDTRGGKALGKNAARDDLAVDEHPVAIEDHQRRQAAHLPGCHSTVTDFARLRGLSMSQPFLRAT